MTKEVILHNTGQAVIEIDGFFLKPNAVVAFTESQAEKLKRLYPDTVKSQDDVVRAFVVTEQKEETAAEEVEAEEDNGSGLKLAEIKQLLKDSGVSFPAGAKKAELLALLEKHSAGE